VGSAPRWAAAIAGAAATCVVVAGPAVAHTELIGSSPADGAALPTPPAEIVLEFNQPVQAQFGEIAVLDESGTHHELGEVDVQGQTVTQQLAELGPGTYQISYRVGSADGHPVSGTLTFTVAGASAPPTDTTPPPMATPTEAAHQSHAGETPVAGSAVEDGNTVPLLLAGGGLAAAAVVGTVLYLATDRRRPGDHAGASEAQPRP
jgi:copper resistance protein C